MKTAMNFRYMFSPLPCCAGMCFSSRTVLLHGGLQWGAFFLDHWVTFGVLCFQLMIGREYKNEEHHDFKHYRVSALLGHTFIPEAKSESTSFLIIPVIGLDIQYWFDHTWENIISLLYEAQE